MNVLDRFTPELKRLVESNFDELSSIQEQAIPAILEGKNILSIAPTGSGKTEAAFLPILDFLFREKSTKPGIHALYIAPLRALNRDMLGRMEKWCEELELNIEVRHGDTPQSQRAKQRLKPPDILITTPETLQAILPAKVMRKHLESVKHVIIDEVHELISDKRGTQLAVGLERLRKVCGNFQTIGLSATVGTPELVADFFKLEETIIDESLKHLELRVEKPSHVLTRISDISGKKSTLIFTNTRVATELLTNQLKGVKDVGIHHSSLSKEERIEAEKKLKGGYLKTLVCTSSMELGIDVGDIEQVIQFNSPRQVSRLIQRVGRSGHRRDMTSRGTVLTGDFDDLIEASVVAKDALEGRLEKTDFFGNSLDVLSHQIVGLTMDYGDIAINDAFTIIKKAYPYKNLKRKQFDSVVDVLKRLRLVGWTETMLSRRKNSLFYYYENLSTIPSYQRYTVIDIAASKPVGVLDEEFVAECYANDVFILKGEAWRIVDFRDRRVMVVPVSDIGADTPVWVGEDIPVPYEVAQEVGRLRGVIAEMATKGKERGDITKKVELPVDAKGLDFLIKTLKEQSEKGLVPTDKLVVVENYIEDYNHIVINSCFGTKVNETLSRLLGALLSSKYGETVGIKVDPYRIILTASGLTKDDVIKTIRGLNPFSVQSILEKIISQTSLFRFAFVHVGKRFGIFKKDANFREINLKRVMDAYEGSAVYDETLTEVFKKYFDLEDTKKVLADIKSKAVKIESQSLTPLSKFGLEEFRDAVRAEVPEKAIVDTVRNRLVQKKVSLVCLHCGHVERERTIERLEFPMKCASCDSWMLANMGSKAEELSKIVKKTNRGEPMEKGERKFLKRAHQSASLIYSYGKEALLAMNARGVGPMTTERILEKKPKGDDFFKEILKAEREFVRTSRFWKK